MTNMLPVQLSSMFPAALWASLGPKVHDFNLVLISDQLFETIYIYLHHVQTVQSQQSFGAVSMVEVISQLQELRQ